MSEAVDATRGALSGERAWLVGGAIRDRLLGRRAPAELDDLDVVVAGDTAAAAKRLARVGRATAFSLSDAFGAWRVVAPGGGWQVDLTPLASSTIEGDLALRDFTVNAIAEPLGGGDAIDPFDGRADIAARRLRMVSRGAFEADPLRTLRLARLACELELAIDEDTAAAARADAERIEAVAAERVFAELKRIVVADSALRGLALVDDLALTERVLPELAALRDVQQSDFHHLDVYDHTLATLAQLIELERDPAAVLGEHADAVAALLAEPLADELTRAGALRFGALLHDAAKPATRGVAPSGRVTFFDHHARGAELAYAALGRLRASERLRAHVAALTRHHLRLGFLVHERPLSRRAVFRYLSASEPVGVDVTVLSIADRLATRGRNADAAIAAHLELGRELLGEALRWRAEGRAASLLRGDELSAELEIPPGPRIGALLAELEEAQFAGEITTPAQALARARELVESERTA
ncbi:MAG TPA: HDIG domain-containing protein [Solirubrobacteraceae bacterium]|nr:HDIG domain-containing protein [Solirubrobacteraceae bacterium]